MGKEEGVLRDKVNVWWSTLASNYSEKRDPFIEFHYRSIHMGIQVLVAAGEKVCNKRVTEVLTEPSIIQSLIGESKNDETPESVGVRHYLDLNQSHRLKMLASLIPVLMNPETPEIGDYV